MKIKHLIHHPEDMNKETLYDLRSLLALYPYYQTARLLMLQNLYILHDPDFDKELRQAAIYITDRKVIFNMIEAAHYKIHQEDYSGPPLTHEKNESRTTVLIDNFLDTMPKEEENKKNSKRQPTPADAAIDYVSYLLEAQEDDNPSQQIQTTKLSSDRTTSLIDNFLEDGGFNLDIQQEETESEELQPQEKSLQQKENSEEETENNEGYFTETLARIYIRQGRYEKALEIIKRLYLNYPKKNAYFADQIRFLEKLIINNKNKK